MGVLLYSVHRSGGLGRVEGSPRFKEIKYRFGRQEVQDANVPIHISRHQKGEPPDIHRPDRGLLTHSHPSRTPEILQVLLRRPPFSIQSSTIRPVIGPQSIHKGPGGASRASQDHSSVCPVLSEHSHSILLSPIGSVRTGIVHQDPRPRVFNKFSEKPDSSLHLPPSPGHGDRYKEVRGLPVSGTSGQYPIPSHPDSKGASSRPSNPFSTARKDCFLHSSSSLGSAPLNPPMVLAPVPETRHQFLQPQGMGPVTDPEILPVVGLPSDGQGNLIQGAQPTHPNIGCQLVRPGSAPAIPVGSGSEAQHKLVRAQSYISGSTTLPQHSGKATRSSPHGQRGGESPYQQARGYPLQVPHGRGSIIRNLGRDQPLIPQGRAHLEKDKLASGFLEQGHSGPLRMAPAPGSFQGDIREVRSSSAGPVRYPSKFPAPEILLPVPVSRGGRGRCPI
ncbi:uncharacterized protein LOC120303858 [Crotalus tigris]|uniref:uncharacterized protein LOC120303858 n=1 Tax=Crotalus tigris TaxID=88082 RepID=UPI00192F5AFA|nr:uncharacterized protein LOC120303858 [Crotalus tigris]